MALLSTILSNSFILTSIFENVSRPKGLWEWLILNVFGFIENYGWRIVVFILILKIILLPLDIFQRYKMRKNAKISEALKPHLEKLKQQYEGDTKLLQTKQMELNKRAGYSYLSSCIPMILTLVIFITLFTGMRNISQYMIFRQYAGWYDTYTAAMLDYENQNEEYRTKKLEYEATIANYNILIKELEESDPTNTQLAKYRADQQSEATKLLVLLSEAESYAQEKVLEYNDENADSFLWIKSLWQPDVFWAKPIESSLKAFTTSTGDYTSLKKDKGNIGQEVLQDMLDQYNKVTKKLVESPENKRNGLTILVILSFLLSVGSQFITQRLQKKSGQFESGAAMGGGTMKVMMIVMPAIIAYFALQYTAAFALYMVANSAMTILISVSTTLFMNLYDAQQKNKAADVVISYGRPDPNMIQSKKGNKNIKNKNDSVIRHGRPDPNNYNKKDSNKKR